MWFKLGTWIYKNRYALIAVSAIWLVVALYFASKVTMTYGFGRQIPTDNPKYLEYNEFKKVFGEDGKMLYVGIESKELWKGDILNNWYALAEKIKTVEGVESIIDITHAFSLEKDTISKKFISKKLVGQLPIQLDSFHNHLDGLKFYDRLLYNSKTGALSMGIVLKPEYISTQKRTKCIQAIQAATNTFETQNKTSVHLSGLPMTRTQLMDLLKHEMLLFTILSVLISILVLYIFFRSFSIIFISIILIALGIINSLAVTTLLGYKITILTGLIPSLITVITIPNIIYLVNNYHAELVESGDKKKSLIASVGNIGIVTLFTNLSTAIGFVVFAFTRSLLLQEFGIVAGINILLLFIFSLILIPSLLSIFPTRQDRETKYMTWKWIHIFTDKIVHFTNHNGRIIFIASAACVVFSLFGLWKLNSNSYMLDDIPHESKMYQDLHWFEQNFGGVMPFEIMIDGKKAGRCKQMAVFEKIDELSHTFDSLKIFAKPLSMAEGIKFATQAYYEGDTSSYRVPSTGMEQSFVMNYLSNNDSSKNTTSKLLSSYMDSTYRYTRISAPMADIGSDSLEKVIKILEPKIHQLFDTTKYKVTLTGTSVMFLEGNNYIIKGMRESILFALLSILVCMIFLFRKLKLVFIALVPNIIPLLVIAGILGLFQIPVKPSSVLVFGIALGISVDVTIRFLVFYAKGKKVHTDDLVTKTVRDCTLSITYSSIILIAGFFIYSFSAFGGTSTLGLLTSGALLLSTIANLTILPVMLKKWD